MTPDDKVRRRDARLEVQVSDVAQRALLMFNIAGDGTIQALYPFGSDLPVIATADYKFPVVVGEPFGADQVVAITSSQRMVDLEQALKKMNQRRAAVEFYRIVERHASFRCSDRLHDSLFCAVAWVSRWACGLSD